MGIGRGRAIAQQRQHRVVVGQARQQCVQTFARLLKLGPGGVEQVVRQPVDAGFEHAHAAGGALEDTERAPVAHQQVEGGVGGTVAGQVLQGGLGTGVVLQGHAHQRAARGGAGNMAARVAIVGQRGEASVTAQPHPGAAGLEVAPGEDVAGVGPPVRGRCRSIQEFVAVRGDDQRVRFMRLPGEDDQAHRSALLDEMLDVPGSAFGDEVRKPVRDSLRFEHDHEGRAIADVLIDLHPGRRVVRPLHQPALHTRATGRGGLHGRDTGAGDLHILLRANPVIDIDVREHALSHRVWPPSGKG
ncbi:protein of unknown function [Thauera humireducens]|nr:protein of unknown function [Thauera humireducens]